MLITNLLVDIMLIIGKKWPQVGDRVDGPHDSLVRVG